MAFADQFCRGVSYGALQYAHINDNTYFDSLKSFDFGIGYSFNSSFRFLLDPLRQTTRFLAPYTWGSLMASISNWLGALDKKDSC